MNTKYYKESSMEDSFIYKSFNAASSVIEKIVKYIKTSMLIDKSYFEEQYLQIKKYMISPLSKNVIDAFDNGYIEILYSKEAKVGISLPFIIRKNNKGDVVATIFISSFGNIDKTGSLTTPVKQLYGIMESAYVALYMQTNPMKIQRNVAIMKISSSIYLEMFTRILNKEYALILEKVLFDKVKYSIKRFFLEKVWEYPNTGLIDSYASSDLENISNMDYEELKINYTESDINDLDKLIKFLGTLSPRMKDLNTRYFIERYITTYHGSAVLSMDYLPYVFFVILNVLISSFLVNQGALNDIVKNIQGIQKFYSELSKTITI